MALRDVLVGVSDATRIRVERLWASHEAGVIDRDEFVETAAAMIAAGNEQATAAADLELAVQMAVDDIPDPLGLSRPEDDVDRLAGSVGTVLAAQITTAETPNDVRASRSARLGRLAAAEPLAAGQDGFMAAMAARGVPGWVRVPDADPCPLCRELSDGRTRPPWVRFARHPGCSCMQQPVFA